MAPKKTPTIQPGTALQGPNGQVAMRMGPGVTAGKYFVIHPDHGGHWAAGAEVEPIESWQQMTAVPNLDAKKIDSGAIDPEQVPAVTK